MTVFTKINILSYLSALLLTSLPACAGQGTACSDFMKLSQKEQVQYLEGYQLGAAMELLYFKNNVLTPRVKKELESSHNEKLQAVAEWGIDGYLEKKYNLINIAFAYPAEFHKNVKRECSKKITGSIGLFDILPSTLTKMQNTGKYPVHGM